MTDCPLSGRGQGHVGNFYIVDLEKTSPQQVVGVQVLSTNSSTVSLWITPTTVKRVVAECTSLLYVGRL